MQIINHPLTPSLKGNDAELKRKEILEYFHVTFDTFTKLFDILKQSESFYQRPNTLRHPLIFYYGHTAIFYINKLNLQKFIKTRFDEYLEKICAIGVDEMSWDDLDSNHYNWPKVETVTAYRAQVRMFIEDFILKMPIQLPITQDQQAYLILMCCEHENIHIETTLVLFRQQQLSLVQQTTFLKSCSSYKPLQNIPINSLVSVSAGITNLGKIDDTYGWDNEYGSETYSVKQFQASKYLVSNGEYLQFVEARGYSTQGYWSEEGWKWVQYYNDNKPSFWVGDVQNVKELKLRVIAYEIEMPWDWPVEVNQLEANAFCKWKKARLMTEPEYYRLHDLYYDQGKDANFNLKYLTACPVDEHSFGDIYDVVGNVWQWTDTNFYGLQGFSTHPAYLDFSTPCFDEQHSMIKGGSFVSVGNEILRSARYAFRRHFHQFAGIRYVKDE